MSAEGDLYVEYLGAQMYYLLVCLDMFEDVPLKKGYCHDLGIVTFKCFFTFFDLIKVGSF